jgi:hypothetical protein
MNTQELFQHFLDEEGGAYEGRSRDVFIKYVISATHDGISKLDVSALTHLPKERVDELEIAFEWIRDAIRIRDGLI